MSVAQKAIYKARKQLQVERKNNLAVAAGGEIVLNAKEKEIDAWEQAVARVEVAIAESVEMQGIVERHTIKIKTFKSTGDIMEDIFPGLSTLGHHHGIKTASTENERKNITLSNFNGKLFPDFALPVQAKRDRNGWRYQSWIKNTTACTEGVWELLAKSMRGYGFRDFDIFPEGAVIWKKG